MRKKPEKPLMINDWLHSGRESRRCSFIYFSGIEHVAADFFAWVKFWQHSADSLSYFCSARSWSCSVSHNIKGSCAWIKMEWSVIVLGDKWYILNWVQPRRFFQTQSFKFLCSRSKIRVVRNCLVAFQRVSVTCECSMEIYFLFHY